MSNPGAPPPYGQPSPQGYPQAQPAGYDPPKGQYPPGQNPYPPQQGAYPQGQAAYPQPVGAYPQPAGAYPQAQHTVVVQPASTIVVAQPMRFGQNPVTMTCTTCNCQIVTTLTHSIGTFTWMIVGVMFLVGFFVIGIIWLCCWIPCVIDGCKDVEHSCPQCHSHLGTYRRM